MCVQDAVASARGSLAARSVRRQILANNNNISNTGNSTNNSTNNSNSDKDSELREKITRNHDV